jgi:four helix bundle protein
MLNIAEGSGRFADSDRKHFYIMARSSAFECAAIVTALAEEGELTKEVGTELKEMLANVSRGCMR